MTYLARDLPVHMKHRRNTSGLYHKHYKWCPACMKKTVHKLSYAHYDAHGKHEIFACVECHRREATVENEMYV